MQSQSNSYLGAQNVTTPGSDYNAIDFMVRQIMGGMATAQLVKVLEVTGAGGVAKAGRVKVEIMVNQITGAGDAVYGGAIYDVPYMRVQGGSSAVILDPEVGDIGLCVFASSDISAVKANEDTSNPGSNRRFSYSDGLYFGGFLNAVPIQYILFGADGIKLVSPVKVMIEAPEAEITATTTITGDTTITGAVAITGDVDITGNATVSEKLTADEVGIGGETQFVKMANDAPATKLKTS